MSGFVFPPVEGGEGRWGEIDGNIEDQTDLQTEFESKADLVGGKVPESQLPAIAISDFIANFADLTTALADSGVQDSQKGDWFTVDTDGGQSYIVIVSNPTTVSDVEILKTPTDAVSSVNGSTGVVVLTQDNIANGSTYVQTENNLTDTLVSNIIDNNDKISFDTTSSDKLDGIEALAEVNNISDANATNLTDGNDSTLHYHSSDRNRANHTGTQAASTISDFDTEVANNSAVIANTAKVSFDTTSSDKLDTIATGAEVNVNADWDATSGDALILNKPTTITTSQSNAIIANTAKVTNANHTGEVNGATTLTIADNVIDEANLKLDEAPTDDYVLTADSTKSGGMKWAEAGGGGGGGTVQDATTLSIRAADEGTTTGNTRGDNAVDLQTDRSSSSQVASGDNSFIGSGERNTASNTYSTIGGGSYNIDSGIGAFIGSGSHNTASSSYSAIGGGSYNITTEQYSIIGSGYGNVTDFYAQAILGGFNLSSNNARQFSYGTLQKSTTDATETEMFIYGTERIKLPTNSVYGFEVYITAVDSDDISKNAYFHRKGLIYNDGGTTALNGSVQTIGTDIDNITSGGVSVEASDTYNALIVKVTGAASTNIIWQAKVALNQLEV